MAEVGEGGRNNLVPGARGGGPLPDIPSEPVEHLRELFAKRLYAIALQPQCLRKFRSLLGSKNEKVRLEAWQLAFTHGWPIAREGAGPARTLVQINNRVGRPPKVVVEGTVVD